MNALRSVCRAFPLMLGCLLLFGLQGRAEESARYDDLDSALKDSGKALLGVLKQKGYANVGVLTFRIRTGDGPFHDNVGELNTGLADRLSVALILANEDEKFGILHNPAQTLAAEKNAAANHLTPEGRTAFFDHKYPLAWGNRKVEAACFVTGEATLSADRSTFTIRILGFDRRAQELQELLPTIRVASTPRILAEMGVNYFLPPSKFPELYDGARGTRDNIRKARETAAKNELVYNSDSIPDGSRTPKREETKPLEDILPDQIPLAIVVLYNNEPQKIVNNRVPEPKEGTNVAFRVTNISREVYGVVVKVNGMNTLFRETYELSQCRKWVLKPGESVTIPGFQDDTGTYVPFHVLPPDAPEENVVKYKDFAGTFQIAAFPGRFLTDDPPPPTPKKLDDESLKLASISRGSLMGKAGRAGSLAALKRDLKGREERESGGSKGMIVEGKTTGSKPVEIVRFRTETSLPTFLLNVRYYEPKTGR